MKGLKGRFLKKIKLIPTVNTLKKGFTCTNPQQHDFTYQNHRSPVYKDQECKININPPEPVIDSEDQKGKKTGLNIDVGHQDTNKPTPKIEYQKCKESDLNTDVGHQDTNKPTPSIEDQKGKGADLDFVVGHGDANRPTPNIEDQKGKETGSNTNVGHQDTNNPTPNIEDHKDTNKPNIEDQKGKENGLNIDVGNQRTNEPTHNIEVKETVIKEDHSPLPVSSNTTVKDENIPEIENNETEANPYLKDFEEKCPPGGEDSVVLYTTSLRGIRKTFKDCSNIKYLLSSFNILVHERDVSMDMEFRDELWRLFSERVVPPKLFIKGRYIGGADEIIGLHEEGKLKELFKGIPSIHIPCRECANMRFLVCPNCDGSRKVFTKNEDNDELCLQCPDCNENGLVKCSVCS
ncbi:F26K24.5 protein [Hibiscus syriacus]|uniref:F26K24.5 protein n=1 Tax=Hibiscus syriacus TaxID=106335 RepID=A0A6A3BHE9_HIBSY|nr:glutaredoxin domain-containing cysteine-rich protein 1-like [Hibiscus syriacus]KAE8715291.1 F26K24.5 protein [Hibiscus syriacus]